MWIVRASRGRVEVPLSVREVDWGPSRERGMVVDVVGAAVEVVADAGGGWDGVSVSAMVGGTRFSPRRAQSVCR